MRFQGHANPYYVGIALDLAVEDGKVLVMINAMRTANLDALKLRIEPLRLI